MLKMLVAVFAASLLVSLLLVALARRLAPGWGLVDRPNARKIHAQVMPKGGGIAIFLSVAICCGLGWALVGRLDAGSLPPSFVKEFVIIFSGGLIIATLGCLDDLYNLSPIVKLSVEALVALLLISQDIRVTLFVPHYWFSLVATLGWFLLITNAFNLLDNMDGLSAGVAFISGMLFLIVAWQTQQTGIAFLLTGLLGSLLGFLCYNFPPATIFMGDCGSLFIGYYMAVLTTQATFYRGESSIFPIALPLLVMAVPLFDTITVSWIRWREKRPIFQADKKHFSHRLVSLGMTNRQAVLTIYCITFAVGLGAILLYQTEIQGGIVIIIQTITILAVIHLLEQVAGRKNHGET